MGTVTHIAGRAAAGTGIDLVLKKARGEDRGAELCRIVDLMEKYMKGVDIGLDYSGVRAMLSEPEGALRRYIDRVLDEVDPHVLRTTALNLGFEAFLHGTKTIREMRVKHNCNIPWVILMDPTSACNLHCTGCWAAEYGNKLNLSYEEMADIVYQGRALGVYFYMFTGGEPLVRKADLLRLCREFRDCQFLAYTNGTLVDEAFCEGMRKAGNLMLALSLEGSPDANDARRGDGVYGKVMRAMALLKAHGLIFGTSICYTARNCEAVTSPDFIRMLADQGCRYALYFHYMPVGEEADPSLLPTPEQRLAVRDRVRAIRSATNGEGLFTMDFQNDGEYVGGCIAAGRNYFHINARGDAEPCVFIHYSGANIRTHTLLECLKQPLFMAYRAHQPFNENHLMPCPMLENPELLGKLVEESGAQSTELVTPESAAHLCEKCRPYAAAWAPCAARAWSEKKGGAD